MADVISKYLAVGVGMFAIAGTLLVWIRRTSRELRSAAKRPDRSIELAMMSRGVALPTEQEPEAAPPPADPLAARAVLAQRGVPAATLEEMSPRELAFMLTMMQGSRGAPLASSAAPADATRTTGRRQPMAPTAPRASSAQPAYRGTVHCPACAGVLGASGPLLHRVTRCPACARTVAIRLDGARVSVEVEDGTG